MARLKDLAARLDLTPGQWLDQCLAAAGSHLAAQKLALLRDELENRRTLSLRTARQLRGEDRDRSVRLEAMADGMQEALRMLSDLMEDR